MAKENTNERTSFYEIGYLLAPTIPEDEAVAAEQKFHDQIISGGGEVLASQSPEMRELSYEIEVRDEGGRQAFDSGQFGWVQFSLNPEDIDAAESIFVKNDDVIRHLLVSVDEEDIGAKPAAEQSEEEE